jgi:hypothetical protein
MKGNMKASKPALRTFFSMMIIIGIAMMIMACEEAGAPSRTFTIKEGEHYSTPRLTESLQSNVLEFEAMFDNSAIYNLGEQSLQSNKNKLLGFSDCNSLHHENSARFAWQWYNDRLEIFAYTYVNGERQEAFIGVVELNQFNHFRLTINDGYYLFQLNGEKSVKMERVSTCNTGLYYKLWPYFGGSVPAPKDVHIAIRSIY